MVGDKEADMEAGLRAGCTPLLVMTGYGSETAHSIDPSIGRFASLVEAVDFILRQDGSESVTCLIRR